MRILLSYFARYRGALTKGLFALLCVNALFLVVPQVVRYVTDRLASGQPVNLWLASGTIVLAVLVMSVCRFCWRSYLIGTGRRIRRDLRVEISRKVLFLPASYTAAARSGDLMALVSNDVEAIGYACGMGTLMAGDSVFLLSAALISMVAIEPRLTLYALTPLALVAVLMFALSRITHARFKAIQESFGAITEQVRDALAGVRVVKSFAAEAPLTARYARLSDRYVTQNIELTRTTSTLETLISFCSGLSWIAVVYFGGQFVLRGVMTIGDLVAFFSYLGFMTWPMMAIGLLIGVIQRGAASAERVHALLVDAPVEDLVTGAPVPSRERLEVRGLSFSYPGSARPILDDVSFVLERGGSLGITGPVASGKSTLVHLLLRVFQPPAGTVRYGGVDLEALNLRELRERIVLVPQESFIFSGTLLENLTFAAPGIDRAQAERALAQASLLEDVRGFPEGLDTIVGERGISLSGGQKQRLALARALLTAPSVLILDDALSAVDARTEVEILRNLSALRGTCSLLVISHRVAVIRECDEILVLSQGVVAQRGKHEALAREEGIYRRLYELQRSVEQ